MMQSVGGEEGDERLGSWTCEWDRNREMRFMSEAVWICDMLA
jgi:hypothetical protein